MTAPDRPVRTELPAREAAVLERAAAGRTYAEIAREWGVAEITVHGAAHRLLRRLGAVNMPNAILLACQAGLLDGQPQRHGDHAGYEAHRKRGEDPKQCPHGCWPGERAYRAALKTRKLPTS